MNGENDYNVVYSINDGSRTIISDNPSSLCRKFFSGFRNQWGESIQGIKFTQHFSFEGLCQGYFNHDLWGGENKDWKSKYVNIFKVKKSEYNSGGECKEDGVRQISTSQGKFSVVCTYKHKPKQESPNVGSTGSSSSTNKQDSDSTSPNGSSAGGGGGGGGSSASHATTPDGGMQGGGKESGSGQGGKESGSGQGGKESGSGKGGASGQGDGGGGQNYELPEVPDSPFGKGDGEPNWGGLKSNGDFGAFKPSSAFSTSGQCPQDILLDFGQFGRHSFSWSPICEAAQRLRYVFITLAYFVSAMMVFRTVNSMKG